MSLLLSSHVKALAQGFGQSFGQGFGQSIQQGFGQSTNNALDNPNLIKKPFKEPEKERTLDDFFPKADTPFVPATPYDMTGLKVTGLDEKYVKALGQNLFIVAENTPYRTMSDIYRDNRLNGKSNIVTADCFVHAYFALNNSILRDVIIEKISPNLSLMLQSMLKEAVSDYKLADDAEVKNDISKNIAYLIVSLRLLEPSLKLPDLGTATAFADGEMKNLAAGKKAKSAIFGSEEDFAYFRPCGFYDRESKLRNFYRCRQWLSRIQFPLTDSDLNDTQKEAQPESRFRQSVLLFRCLDKATVNGAPAMEYWNRFYRVWQLMGARENANEHPLLPPDFKAVFRASNQNLSNLLQGLSEPFFRTKLLLSIRRNRPLELNSTSILATKKKEDQPAERAVFRMMPLADEPELPWMAALAQTFNEPKGSSDATPFALLELYARESTLATNILSEICWKLDAELFNSLPSLIEVTGRKRAVSTAPIAAGSQEGRWAILSNYFKPMTDSTQSVLKSDLWMRRRLLSAFSAWVDSHVALLGTVAKDAESGQPSSTITANVSGKTSTAKSDASVAKSDSAGTPATTSDKVPASTATKTAAAATATTTTTTTTTTAAASGRDSTGTASLTSEIKPAATAGEAEANSMVRPKVANYLEPAPLLYKSLRTKMQQTIDELSAIDYLPAARKQSAQELIALCQRLEDISRKEISNNFVAPPDSRFLGNIDLELDKFPAPLQAVLHLENDTVTDKSGKNTSGANLCLGKPGLLFMLLHIGRGQTLSRGAEYTYYEVPGGALNPVHWDRKLQFTTAQPPKWVDNFEVQQQLQQLQQSQQAQSQGQPRAQQAPQAQPAKVVPAKAN